MQITTAKDLVRFGHKIKPINTTATAVASDIYRSLSDDHDLGSYEKAIKFMFSIEKRYMNRFDDDDIERLSIIQKHSRLAEPIMAYCYGTKELWLMMTCMCGPVYTT